MGPRLSSSPALCAQLILAGSIAQAVALTLWCGREDAGEREDMAVDRSGVYERDRATGPGPAKCALSTPVLSTCCSSWPAVA